MRSYKKLLSVGHTEFIENAGEVMSNRNAGDAQAIGYVLIRKAFADQSHHLALSFRQTVRPLGGSGGRGRRSWDGPGVAQLQ